MFPGLSRVSPQGTVKSILSRVSISASVLIMNEWMKARVFEIPSLNPDFYEPRAKPSALTREMSIQNASTYSLTWAAGI